MQSGGQREVGEGADIVVCEINGILILQSSIMVRRSAN